MRVLHVLDHSLPLHSGYTFRTRAILKAQTSMGIEVRGITGLRHNDEGALTDPEVVDGLTFHRSTGLAGGPPVINEIREMTHLSLSIQELAKKWRPDIIHAHSPALCGGAAWRASRALDVPLVYEIRAFWEDAAIGNGTGREGSIKYRMTRALETQIVRRADAVFTICDGLRSDLVRRGINPGKLGIMRNGVDMAMFGDPPPRDERLASKLNISADAPVIGFIGSFYAYEGLDDLIAAMPRLREQHPGTRLLLVGGGEMEAEWREQAAKLPDPDAVIFTGRVPHSEVERYYSLIDVLAYPRKHSRLTDLVTPLKPLEAMAQQRIVAASDVGGHRELITHNETGFLFPPDDPAACADALANMLNARESWNGVRMRGIEHVRRSHDWAQNAKRYRDVYQSLLANRDETSNTMDGVGANKIGANG